MMGKKSSSELMENGGANSWSKIRFRCLGVDQLERYTSQCQGVMVIRGSKMGVFWGKGSAWDPFLLIHEVQDSNH